MLNYQCFLRTALSPQPPNGIWAFRIYLKGNYNPSSWVSLSHLYPITICVCVQVHGLLFLFYLLLSMLAESSRHHRSLTNLVVNWENGIMLNTDLSNVYAVLYIFNGDTNVTFPTKVFCGTMALNQGWQLVAVSFKQEPIEILPMVCWLC